MKRKFYLIVLFLLVFFAAWLSANPYIFETRTRDYNPDVIFSEEVDVKELRLKFDYSEGKSADDAMLGSVEAKYGFEHNNDINAIVPFFVSLRSNSSDFQSKVQRSFNTNLSYKEYYGPSKNNFLETDLIKNSYNYLLDNKYLSNYSDSLFYFYEYDYQEDLMVGIDYEAINRYGLITSNLAYKNLTKKEIDNLDDSFNNDALLVPTIEEKSFIISKEEIDFQLSSIQNKVIFSNSTELFSYLLSKYDDVDIDDALVVLENEILNKFDNIGLNSISLDDIVNEKRLLIYNISIPQNVNEFVISYNSVTGMDSRYEYPLYEFNFNLNKKNYQNIENVKVDLILCDDVPFVNFTILNLKKEGHVFSYESNELPIEFKYFFSKVEETQKTFDTFMVEVSGYAKYIIIPLLFLILLSGCILFLVNKLSYMKNNGGLSFKQVISTIYSYIISNIPELLTFYLIGFKFYTLYVGDSSFNIINSIFVLVFIFFCGIYFLINTRNSINYLKFILYSILALLAAWASKDYVFIMLLALGACFVKKGPKEYCRSMYISITIMFIVTLLLCAFGTLKNDVFYIWNIGDFEPTETKRNSLGFGHPNTVSLFLFVGISCYILYNKPSWTARIFGIILVYGCYYYTHSRTGCITLFILIILDTLSDFIKLKGRWRYIFSFLFIGFTAATYLMAIRFGYVGNKLNDILSGRLTLIHDGFIHYDWVTLRGIPEFNLIIDNLYMNVIFYEGFITYGVYALLYTITAIKVVKSNNTKYLAVLITYFIFSMFEATLMSYSTAFFIPILFISSLSDKYMIDGKIKDELLNDRVILHIVPEIEMATLDNNQKNIILVTSKNSKKEVKDNVEIYYNKGYIYIVVILIVFMKKYGIDKINVISPNNSVLLALLSINMQAKDIYIDAKDGFLKKQLSKKYNIKNELLEV
ncbi:MAG: hypothetical protein MR357_04065 [Anaeroplasma sp.]|nr:hypothetical protein [Anaeroplasma sp.]